MDQAKPTDDPAPPVSAPGAEEGSAAASAKGGGEGAAGGASGGEGEGEHEPPPSLAAKLSSLLTVIGYMASYKWPFVVFGAYGLVLEGAARAGFPGAWEEHVARLGSGTLMDSYGEEGVVDTASDGKRLIVYLIVSLFASHLLRDPRKVTLPDKFLAGMGHWAVGRAVCGFTFWGCLPLILWDGYYYGKGYKSKEQVTAGTAAQNGAAGKAEGKAE